MKKPFFLILLFSLLSLPPATATNATWAFSEDFTFDYGEVGEDYIILGTGKLNVTPTTSGSVLVTLHNYSSTYMKFDLNETALIIIENGTFKVLNGETYLLYDNESAIIDNCEAANNKINFTTAAGDGLYIEASTIDLEILPSDISFSPSVPLENSTVNITVQVRNTMAQPATTGLKLLVNSVEVGTTSLYVAGGGSNSSMWQYTVNGNGTYTVEALADQADVVAEGDETNNNATKDLIVYNAADIISVNMSDSIIDVADFLGLVANTTCDDIDYFYMTVINPEGNASQYFFADVGGNYNYSYNASTEGEYRVIVVARSKSGIDTTLLNQTFIIAQEKEKCTVSVTANTIMRVNITADNTTFILLNLTQDYPNLEITAIKYTDGSVLNSLLDREVNIADVTLTYNNGSSRTFKFLSDFMTIKVPADLNSKMGLSTLTLPYSEATLTALGLNEDTLVITYYNETSDEWDILNSTIDTANNTLSANITHFSSFAPAGFTPYSGLPSTPGGGGGGGSAKEDGLTVSIPTEITVGEDLQVSFICEITDCGNVTEQVKYFEYNFEGETLKTKLKNPWLIQTSELEVGDYSIIFMASFTDYKTVRGTHNFTIKPKKVIAPPPIIFLPPEEPPAETPAPPETPVQTYKPLPEPEQPGIDPKLIMAAGGIVGLVAAGGVAHKLKSRSRKSIGPAEKRLEDMDPEELKRYYERQ